jgi:hypothetical protein
MGFVFYFISYHLFLFWLGHFSITRAWHSYYCPPVGNMSISAVNIFSLALVYSNLMKIGVIFFVLILIGFC